MVGLVSSVQSDDIEIRNLGGQITKGTYTDYEKARLIHDWVAENIWYDHDAASDITEIKPSDQTAISVLHNKRGVCAGYTNLTAALLRSIGIPCKVISGEVAHWNAPEKGLFDEAPMTAIATPASSSILINGEKMYFEGYNIDNNNYFKLRDLAYALKTTEKCFDVEWNNDTKTISIITGKTYTLVGGEMETGMNKHQLDATINLSPIYLNEEKTTLTSYTINGNNYFKLRDIANTLDFEVNWSAEINAININLDPFFVNLNQSFLNEFSLIGLVFLSL